MQGASLRGRYAVSKVQTMFGAERRVISRSNRSPSTLSFAYSSPKPWRSTGDQQGCPALVETLSFRQIGVVQEEYAVSSDGMKMFGVLDLETQMEGCRFSIGIRNSHDKSIRLGLTAGLRVFVCSNMAFSGDFTPVLAKHTKSFNLIDTLSVGVDRIQRNFEPLQRQVELWRKTQITDDTAKLIFYSAFIDGKFEAPRTLLPEVHRLYFEPQNPEFAARTMWSLSNAFTSAFKKLGPVPQFKATAKLGGFLAQLPA
jgi:hypothetical protein